MKKTLPVILLSFVFCGCTIVDFYYFRNHSDRPVEILFQTTDYYKQHNFPVQYSNSILTINRKTYSRLNDSLSIDMLPHYQASLSIPAHSTVLLPRHPLSFNISVYLKQGNKIDSIDLGGLNRTNRQFKFITHGFPFRSRSYVYDYK
jgi:hypothetical protein